MDKRAELLALAKKRQNTRWDGYKCIGDYHDGVYECDFVSPYTKSAGNVDADIMVMLQDWWSDKGMIDPRIDEDSVKLGYSRSSPTDRNLICLLKTTFDLGLEDIYATNLFPFIKPGGMSAHIPQRDLIRAADEFALPQITIVNPKLVICLGIATFNAVRQACQMKRCPKQDSAIESPFNVGRTRVWGQAHSGRLGQNNRNRGGVDRVSGDWRRMKIEMMTSAGSKP